MSASGEIAFNYAYFGLNGNATTNEWSWESGAPFEYTNWDWESGYPRDDDERNCVTVYLYESDWFWYNVPCHYGYYSLCEWEGTVFS